ncbi:MAG: hypothetical protein ACRD12_04320, partial [Acidimicrobiales bacterium]
MRRAFATTVVVLALVATGCGATQGDQGAEVSAGPRPPSVAPSGRLGGPSSGAAAGAPGPVAPQV